MEKTISRIDGSPRDTSIPHVVSWVGVDLGVYIHVCWAGVVIRGVPPGVMFSGSEPFGGEGGVPYGTPSPRIATPVHDVFHVFKTTEMEKPHGENKFTNRWISARYVDSACRFVGWCRSRGVYPCVLGGCAPRVVIRGVPPGLCSRARNPSGGRGVPYGGDPPVTGRFRICINEKSYGFRKHYKTKMPTLMSPIDIS